MVQHIRKLRIPGLLLLLAIGAMSVEAEAQSATKQNTFFSKLRKQKRDARPVKDAPVKNSAGNTNNTSSTTVKNTTAPVVKKVGTTALAGSTAASNAGANTGRPSVVNGKKVNYLDMLQWSPGGFFDSVIDGNGKKYSLGQICSDNTIRKAAWGYGSEGTVRGPGEPEMHGFHHPGHHAPHVITEVPTTVCSSGYFQLYLETGCGMEEFATDATHMDRLTVMCQVLKDLSNFIESPLTVTGQKVNIWIRAYDPSTPAGGGAPFYSVPSYNIYSSGIADNLCWITINSGRDASHGIVSPLSYAGGGTGAVFFHAAIQFNFDAVPYHASLAPIVGPSSAGKTDLYMVALHEMLHVLGFAGQIDQYGNSIKGYGYQYYNRYDKFLHTPDGSPKPLIVQDRPACGGMYGWKFNPDIASPLSVLAPGPGHSVCGPGGPADLINCPTAIQYYGTTVKEAVYTPDCFQFGASLSHFEDQCFPPTHPFFTTYPLIPNANGHYYVMANSGHVGPYDAATNPGAMKRYPTWEERSVMCDIGYRVRTTFGDGTVAPGPNWNYHEYTGEEICGTIVAGINDGIEPTGYKYITTPGTTVRINGGALGSLLDNDNAASFKCLELVYGSNPGFATLSATTGMAGTPIDFTPYSMSPGGVYLLRYVPVSASGVEGNITYVFVYVSNDHCEGEPGCDLVSDGGFEGVGRGLDGTVHDLHCAGEPFSGSPDLFTRCGTHGLWSFPGTPWFTPGTDVHPFSGTDNYHFVGAGGGRDGTIFFAENIKNKLATGLAPGNYNVSFWAKLSNPGTGVSIPTQLQIGVSSVNPLPAIPYFMFALPPTVDPIANFTLRQPDDEWHYYSQNFAYTGAGLPDNLLMILSPWLNPPTHPLTYLHYYVIDDISIKPAVEVPSIILPSAMSLCGPIPPIDLNTHITSVPGITGGTWHWYTTPLASDGEPTETHSNMFDPAAAYDASIASGGNGHITVCYSYMRDDCEHMVCHEIHIEPRSFSAVVSPYPLCPTDVATITCTPIDGYPMTQNYVYAGVPAVTCTTPTCDVATVTATTTSMYTITETTSGCMLNVTVTVNPELPPITGPTWVCRGSMVTMHNDFPAGAWSDDGTGIVAINAITGDVTGIATGTATINYSAFVCGVPRVVTTTIEVYVHPSTSSTGSFNLCAGQSLTMSNIVPYGIWSSSDGMVAGVDPFTGVVTGGISVSTPSTAIITYTLDCDGCSTTQEVTVNPMPSAIFGAASACVGGTRALGNTLPGGTWSSSTPAIGSVDPLTGIVTGIAAGTTTITYTMPSGCFSTMAFIVGPVATTITGPSTICVPSMIAPVYTSDMPGGAWASSNTSVVDIYGTAPYEGTAIGHMPGTAILTYSLCGIDVTYPVTLINGLGTPISGPGIVCVGSTIDLDNFTPGGTWSSSHTGIATVDPATGVVTGVTPGTATITYTVPTGCFVIQTVTVNWTWPVTGPDEVCVGSTITLSHPTPGGAWTSGSTAVATVVGTSGEVTGVAPGLVMISYSSSPGCVATPLEVLVRPLPPVITGTTAICSLATTTLHNSDIGGTWESLNTTVGTIDATTGVFTGLAIGTATIRYTNTHGCSRTTVVTVAFPSLTEDATVCEGSVTTLTSSMPGGTWASADEGVVTIGSASGDATGVAPGTTAITYTSPGGCVATMTIEVYEKPEITGAGAFCSNSFLSLSVLPTGGTWSSSDPSVVVIGPIVNDATWGGGSMGTATITYTLPTGCIETVTVTVNPAPAAITGALYVCAGNTTTLSNIESGGTWSSSDDGIASVGSATGVVTGHTSGTAVITYTMPLGCYATAIVSVNPTPDAITGPVNICFGVPRMYFANPPGGTWSISDPSKLSVVSVATTGENIVVAGTAPGSVTLTYTLCGNSVTYTINVAPPISGSLMVCPGYTTTLTHPASGGLWLSENPAIASVGIFTGVVTGNTAGTVNIRYVVSGLCATLVTVTVNSTIATITGDLTICVGGTTDLDNPVSGGTWSSGGAVSIDASTGVATGVSTGTAVITYDIGVGCKAEAVLSVAPAVAAISGLAPICDGSSIPLASTTSGGTWSSSNAAVASIGSISGDMLGESPGTATITYFVSSGCMTTFVATVNIMPDAITGADRVCEASTITLSSTTPGGVWESSAPSVASVGSLTGIVTGESAGTAVISYIIGDCYVTKTVTVDPLPAAITGAFEICDGAVTTLASTTSGGTWSSSNTAVASIGSGTGEMTGTGVGTATITYMLSTGCYVTQVVTVNIMPDAITGADRVCETSTITLASTTSGGVWESSAPSIASVGSLTGIVTGESAGTAVITYIIGDCYVTKTVTVDPLPAAITGTFEICDGAVTTLASTTSGGTWSSSNTAVASIGSVTGSMTGAGVGTATITYMLSTGCYVTQVVTVNIMPDAITGGGSICVGGDITLSNATAGGTWQSSAPSVASIGSATGIVTGNVAGTATITYRIADCYVTTVVTVNGLPTAIGGIPSVCAGSNRTLTNTVSGGTWSSSNTAVGTVNATTGVVTGISTGSTTITYMLPTGCFRTVLFTVDPSLSAITGASTVCGGATIPLSNSTPGGTWSESYAGILTVDAAGVVTGVATGAATVTYSFSAGCYVTKTVTVDAPSIGSGGTGIVDVGSTITLTGTASGGTWSASNSNATVGSSSGIVTGAAGGTVIITYMRSTGCYATRQVTVCAPYTVSIEQIAPISTGTDHEIAFCPGMLLQVNGAPIGATYTWSVSPTTTATPVPAATAGQFSFAATPAPHTYTLTVTANSGGCKETSTIVMVVNNGGCFPCDYFKPDVAGACPIVPYFKTITDPVLDGSNILGGTPYYFIAKSAKLEVDPFAGQVFYMGYDVELTVEQSIVLKEVHFFSGAGMFCRWKGISVVNDDPVAGSIVVTGNTLIENASDAGVQLTVGVSDDAIIPPGGMAITSDGAIYNRNDAGIRIDHFQLNSSIVDYPFQIQNNVFTNRQFNQYVDPTTPSPVCSDYYPFKWPSVDYLKTAPLGEVGLNPDFEIDNFHGFPTTLVGGIAVVNSGSTDDSHPDHTDTYYDGMVYNGIVIGNDGKDNLFNLFDTIMVGAYVSNSNVKFYNNVFRHTPNPYPITTGSGVGIHGYQDVTLLSEKKAIQLLPGTGEHTNNRFYNCYNSFYSSSYYTFISQRSWVSATLYDATPTSIGVQNYGFRFGNTMYGNHIMENNEFRNLYGSIVSAIPSCANPYGRIRIKDNNIIDITSSSGNEIGYYGIRVLDQSTCPPSSNSLEITGNYVQGSSWGIEVYGNSDHISSLRTSIRDNKVVVMDNGRIGAWTRLGIVCRQLSNLAEVVHNTVTGDPLNGVDFNTYTAGMPNSQGLSAYTAMHFFNVDGPAASNVSCNLVKHMPIGFKFEHQNNIRWRNNVMEQNKYGLVLHSYFDFGVPTFYDGTITHQGTNCDPVDNVWYDPGPDALTGWVDWADPNVSQTFTAGTDPGPHSHLYVRPYTAALGFAPYIYEPTNNNTWTLTYPSTSVGTAYASGTSIFDAMAGCTGVELTEICADGIPEDPKWRGVAAAAVEDDVKHADVNAYMLTPNPTTGNIVITQKKVVNETADVKVMNATGQVVYSGALQFTQGHANFSLLHPTPGMYMLTMVNNAGETVSFRIVVQ